MDKRILTLGLLVISVTIFLFQNCGQTGFEANQKSSSSLEGEYATPDQASQLPPPADETETPGPEMGANPTPNPTPTPTPPPMVEPLPNPSACNGRSPLQNELKNLRSAYDLAWIRSKNQNTDHTFWCQANSRAPSNTFAPPARGPANRTYVEPWWDFVQNLSRDGDLVIMMDPNSPARATAASCLLDVFHRLAASGTLAEARDSYTDNQGEMDRMWLLGSLNLTFNKLKDDWGATSPEKRTVIQQWLTRSGAILEDKWDRHIAGRPQNENLTFYWSGVALMANGLNLNIPNRVTKGIGYLRKGLDQIQANGTLPLEMAEGGNAFFYHVQSLQVLTYGAEIARLNNVDLYSYNSNALNRLTDLVIRSFQDFTVFTRLTPTTQTYDADELIANHKVHLTWAEQVYTRTGDARILTLVKALRPLVAWRLSDTTFTHGLKCLE